MSCLVEHNGMSAICFDTNRFSTWRAVRRCGKPSFGLPVQFGVTFLSEVSGRGTLYSFARIIRHGVFPRCYSVEYTAATLEREEELERERGREGEVADGISVIKIAREGKGYR